HPSIQSVLGVFWIHSSVMGSDDWQNVTSKKHRRSKEDDVLNISKSVYVTNFPDSTSAQNLCTIWIGRFHLFANHVRFDRPHSPPKVPTTAHKNSFIAVLKDSNVKEASVEPAIVLDDSCIKEFDFNLSLMGFLNVKIKYLGGMWLLFDFDSFACKQKFLAHTGVRSWFSILKQADNNFVNNERIIWVSVEGLPVKAWTHNSFRKIASVWGELVEWEDDEHTSFSCKNLCLKTKMDVVINDKRKIIIHGIAYWIRVKEFDAWVPDFEDDDDIEDSEVDKVSKTSFIQEFDHVLNSSVHDEAPQSKAAEALSNEETPVSEDPFGIYGLLHKNNNNNSGSMESVDPKFPPGFTPSTSDQEKPKEDPVQVSSNCAYPSSSRTRESKKNRGMTSFPNSHSGSFKQKTGGSIIDLMDELVNVGRAMGYKMDGCMKDIESIIGSKGEINFHR
ncbi:RNA-directed DNA polymerase, eukaryota, partial [Tanacetum coccineum]